MGSPAGAAETPLPPAEALESNTFLAFADMDASPTKAWLIAHQHDSQWKWHYNFAFGKRPPQELYDLKKDPDQVNNVANDPAYFKQKEELSERLMRLLTDARDPRVTGDGKTFDRSPFSDAPPENPNKGAKKRKGK